MRLHVLALLIVLPSADAWAAGFWLTVGRHGLDSQGRSGAETYEILPDGRMRWDTASLGQRVAPGCGAGGGRFEKMLPAEKIADLSTLAIAAIRSQKAPPAGAAPEARSPRELRWSMSLSSGKDYQSAEIREATPEWRKLIARLGELSAELEPTAAVSIAAIRRGPDAIEVRFTAPGDDPVEIPLPERASEAFKVEGYEVSYAADPRMGSFTLGKGSSQASIRLKLKAAGGRGPAQVVSYSNALIRHHGDKDPLEGGKRAPELNLCAPVRDR